MPHLWLRDLTQFSFKKLQVLSHGVGLSSSSDSELMTQLLALSPPDGEPNGPNWLGRIQQLMNETPMAYALLIMHEDSIYAVRDPYGNRPLCIGRLISPGFEGKNLRKIKIHSAILLTCIQFIVQMQHVSNLNTCISLFYYVLPRILGLTKHMGVIYYETH